MSKMELGITILVNKGAKTQRIVITLDFGQEGRYVLDGIYVIPVSRVIIKMKSTKSSQVIRI